MGYQADRRDLQPIHYIGWTLVVLAFIVLVWAILYYPARVDLVEVESRQWVRLLDEEHKTYVTRTTCESQVPWSDRTIHSRSPGAHRHSRKGGDRHDDLVTWGRWEWVHFETRRAVGADPVASHWPEVKPDEKTRASNPKAYNRLRLRGADEARRYELDVDWSQFVDAAPGTRWEVSVSLWGWALSIRPRRSEE